jgi:hypothetical protein
MPQCQFLFSAVFVFSEKLYRKYSPNWMKQNPKFLFIWHEDGVQRGDGDQPGGGPTIGWRGPTPVHARPWCGPPGRPLTSPIRLYIHFIGKTLRAQASIHKKYYKPPPSSTLVQESPEALPGTLPERGIITECLLHRHAYLRNDAWVVHPWTMGP